MKTLRHVLAVFLSITIASCAVVSRRAEVTSVDYRAPVAVSSPVKAHLKDGSTVVYPNGATVTADAIEGEGTRHNLTLTEAAPVSTVPLDQVVGMETYRLATNEGKSFVLSTLATAAATTGVVFGTGALMVALFGSCPTVYSADGSIEEAELFSSSIAPLFEGRDLDLLKTQPDASGLLSLDIRNEAMETHYLNHLQLVEVQHATDEVIVPEVHGALLALSDMRPVRMATDRRGRDVTDLLAKADSMFYVTGRSAIGRASATDMDDWIDLTVPVPAGSTSATLAFRMRNSLLNTVLLYDVMLAPAGAGALDWLGGDLASPSTAATPGTSGALDWLSGEPANRSTATDLGRWHQRRGGLHISVWEDDGYREVARVPDSGPIAWHDIGAVVPVPAGETRLRVRLSFLVDHWRIDRLGISVNVREAASRVIPLSSVRGSTGRPDPDALSSMNSPDERYLQTNPGHRFYADFEAGPATTDRERTFLLSSQGYYTEWIRGTWIQNATEARPFVPTDEAIVLALAKWSATRDSFEQRFLNSRVPVR